MPPAQEQEERTACGGSLLRRSSSTECAVAAPARSSHAKVIMYDAQRAGCPSAVLSSTAHATQRKIPAA